ncbi:acyl carrier protein [Microtetraspora malaysiensis]|uniref:acyl carrier protein n=1 Tax=Microtetraspora malaysiensis TaxID=161358 RepID=UPI003D8C1758
MAQVTGCERPREDPHLNLPDGLGVDSLATLELVEILEKQLRTLADRTSVVHRLTSTGQSPTQMGKR